jgi:hypothetical protein
MSLLDLYGIDFEEEQKRMLEQQSIVSKVQAEAQKKQQEMGSSSGGQQGMGSPMDILQQAEGMAQQYLTLPEEQRRMELGNVMRVNPLLHDAIMGAMNRMRNQMRTQGMHQIMQQQGGQ